MIIIINIEISQIISGMVHGIGVEGEYCGESGE